MKITVLGCGSSTGVPIIGCGCTVCLSNNPKNKRTRVSVFVEVEGRHILLDTSPDLRQQALREHITRIDAVLYTHEHADHIGGLDDLRAYNVLQGDAIPIYANAETLGLIRERFPYAFLPKPEKIWYRPCLTPNVIPDKPVVEFDVLGVSVKAFEQVHGKVKTFGYRIGNFSYSTDTDALDETAFAALKGTEVWVVDCLRYSDSYTHSNLKRTLEWIERVKPRMAILTHMAHDFDYDTLFSELPSGVVPGYDGIIAEL
jgi:phosphoribosyl 1,2-cyclic phosphate phosphodiesterase